MALGKVNFLDAHPALWSLGTTGENKRKKHIQTLLFWARENVFLHGSRKWQFSLIISTNHRLFSHPCPSAFPFLLHSETSPNEFQLWNPNEGWRLRKKGWDAWSSDTENEGADHRGIVGKSPGAGNSRRDPTNSPSFLVSRTHPSGRARPYCNPRRKVLRKQGHEVRGKREICTLYFFFFVFNCIFFIGV